MAELANWEVEQQSFTHSFVFSLEDDNNNRERAH
jgi:hypothetical protein